MSTVHHLPPAIQIPLRRCTNPRSWLAGELEGGEVHLLRAEFTGESNRRGDFTVDPPSAELCSSRAAAIGAQEDLQQVPDKSHMTHAFKF